MFFYRKPALYSGHEESVNKDMDACLLRVIGRTQPMTGHIPATGDPERIYFRRKAEYYTGIGANLAVYVAPDQDTSEVA